MKGFLLGIVLAVLLAQQMPWLGLTGGPVRPEITIKLLGVATIFFCSGLKKRLRDAMDAVKNWRAHAMIQSFHFGVAPLIFVALHSVVAYIATSFHDGALDASATILLSGLTLVGCLPPPISSAVLLTEVSAGNTAIAIINSTGGSFIGLLLTPPLLIWATGRSVLISPQKLFLELAGIVVLPLFVGLLAQRGGMKPLPGAVGKAMLVLIIWHVFCETFSKPIDIEPGMLLLLGASLVVVQCLVIALTSALSHFALKQRRRDTVATVFTCYHKSLTLGMPILLAMYGDDLSFEVVAILIYHPVQIMLGSVLVPWASAWVGRDRFEDVVDATELEDVVPLV